MHIFCDNTSYPPNVKKNKPSKISFFDNPAINLISMKFTSREKKILSYAALFFALLTLLWIFFAPNRGILDLFRTKEKLEQLQAENKKLEEENKVLQEEIDRLQNDPGYLEEKARKEYGMLKENEMLYIFKKKK
jgi:cell division protein FtsB